MAPVSPRTVPVEVSRPPSEFYVHMFHVRKYPNRPFFLCRSAPHSLYDWLHRRLVWSPWPEESAAVNSAPRSHCSTCVRQRRLIDCPLACLRRREGRIWICSLVQS
ncbi:hypothetical protein SETIT_8G222400v2 [Setaria italica]|uniref:Uncharacterized protein n=1 Tax=Setaria italica TaxID=4555 RepID=A0A368SC47_SETIT|nr:hypothetical protein SETIT_8G222400v2 [Setaria italica]